MTSQPQRLYYIDWLRLLAVFLLFFYHTARIFDPWESFYAQNDVASPVIGYSVLWAVGPWHMSLFFLLAGASTYYALRRRTGREYVRERFMRLFIPFVFGVLVLIPPQSYLGLVQHSGYSGSFHTWYPDFFALQLDDIDGYFMGGHTWGHLWFIFHLFVYSLIAISLFLYLNRESGNRLVGRFAAAFTRPLVFFLFPMVLVAASEFPEVAGGNPLFYIIYFVSGFVLMSDARFMDVIDRYRVALLVLGPALFTGMLVTWATGSWPPGVPEWADEMAHYYFNAAAPWFIILAMLGYGRRFLGSTNRFLNYFAEGAYPLYILHQTVIVIVGFYVVRYGIGIPSKYALIVAGSFAGTVFLYDIAVKRTKVTRFLFGLKPRRSKAE